MFLCACGKGNTIEEKLIDMNQMFSNNKYIESIRYEDNSKDKLSINVYNNSEYVSVIFDEKENTINHKTNEKEPEYTSSWNQNKISILKDSIVIGEILLKNAPQDVFVEFSNSKRFVVITVNDDNSSNIYDLENNQWVNLDVKPWIVKWSERDNACLIQTIESKLYLCNTTTWDLLYVGGDEISNINISKNGSYIYKTEHNEETTVFLYNEQSCSWDEILKTNLIYDITDYDGQIVALSVKKQPAKNPLSVGAENQKIYIEKVDVKTKAKSKLLFSESQYIKNFVFSRTYTRLYYTDGAKDKNDLYYIDI